MSFRRVSIFSLLFVFCFITYSSTAHAFRDRCPRHEVKTELKAKRSKTKFYHATLENINDYLNSHTVLAFVSRENLFVDNQYDFEVSDIGGGWYCVNLEKMKSYFHVAATINMPKDFKRGSCEYNIILEHEKRHLKEIYDFHEENTSAYRRYQATLVKNLPVFKPVRTESEIEDIKSKIANYVGNSFSELIYKSLDELNKAQEAIDSPQEYTFNNRRLDRCNDEDPKRPNKKSFPGHTLD
ncbi:MAG: hypothetical protein ACRBDI_08265 [Alphaproteobacteria bacterium]